LPEALWLDREVVDRVEQDYAPRIDFGTSATVPLRCRAANVAAGIVLQVEALGGAEALGYVIPVLPDEPPKVDQGRKVG